MEIAFALLLVFGFIVYMFPKQVLGTIAVVVIGGVVWYQNYQGQKAKVAVQVIYAAGTTCQTEFPLHVTITNNSGSTVEKVGFDVVVKRPGHSTDIGGYMRYASDTILVPGYKVENCWGLDLQSSVEDDPSTLVYSSSVTNVDWQ